MSRCNMVLSTNLCAKTESLSICQVLRTTTISCQKSGPPCQSCKVGVGVTFGTGTAGLVGSGTIVGVDGLLALAISVSATVTTDGAISVGVYSGTLDIPFEDEAGRPAPLAVSPSGGDRHGGVDIFKWKFGS